jgi:hypothetical protein
MPSNLVLSALEFDVAVSVVRHGVMLLGWTAIRIFEKKRRMVGEIGIAKREPPYNALFAKPHDYTTDICPAQGLFLEFPSFEIGLLATKKGVSL